MRLVSLVPDGHSEATFPYYPGVVWCSHCLQQRGTRVILDGSDVNVPVSLVPKVVHLILIRKKMGTTWWLSNVRASNLVFRFTLQGYKSISCRLLTIIRDYLINWP
jgi:hypothetical protein